MSRLYSNGSPIVYKIELQAMYVMSHVRLYLPSSTYQDNMTKTMRVTFFSNEHEENPVPGFCWKMLRHECHICFEESLALAKSGIVFSGNVGGILEV